MGFFPNNNSYDRVQWEEEAATVYYLLPEAQFQMRRVNKVEIIEELYHIFGQFRSKTKWGVCNLKFAETGAEYKKSGAKDSA